MTIRMAQKTDLYKIAELLHEIDHSFPIPLSKKINLEELALKFLDKGYALVAWDKENAVGLLGFYANDMQKQQAYVSVLGVRKDYWRRGIARQLLVWALDFCRAQNMQSCALYTHKSNQGAITLYEKLGFHGEEDADRPDDIRFVKIL